MPSTAPLVRRAVAGRVPLALAIAATLAIASLAPATLAAQRVAAPRFQPLSPPQGVFVESLLDASTTPPPVRRHHFTCAQARVAGGTGGAVVGGFSGFLFGAVAALFPIPFPRESGSPEARAATRRLRAMTIGGAVLGATGGVLIVDCSRL